VIRRLCNLAIFLAVFGSARAASAHGVVGDYIFLEPIVTQDPTPANEFDILQPSWVKSSDANTYSIGFSLEKVLYTDAEYVPRFSVGASNSWQHVSPYAGPSLEGFGDLTMFAKYAIYYSLDHEFLMSLGVQLQLPVGNTPVAESYEPWPNFPLGKRHGRYSEPAGTQVSAAFGHSE
jgi:hypothetical protein